MDYLSSFERLRPADIVDEEMYLTACVSRGNLSYALSKVPTEISIPWLRSFSEGYMLQTHVAHWESYHGLN